MVDPLLGATLTVAVGVLVLTLALYSGYTTRRARRKGLKLTAHVVEEEASTSLHGVRTYHTRVRFQAPDGNWVENVPVRGHGKPRRPGATVAVWYDASDPTRVTFDEPGTSRMLFFWLAVGLVVVGFGVLAIIHPG